MKELLWIVGTRLAAGFLIASLLAPVFGPDGSPPRFLAAVVVACGVVAVLLDRYERPIMAAALEPGESPQPSAGTKPEPA